MPALDGGATRPMNRSPHSWRLVGASTPSRSVAFFRSSARRSARASEASAIRRICRRSWGRAAAIARWKWARAFLAS